MLPIMCIYFNEQGVESWANGGQLQSERVHRNKEQVLLMEESKRFYL